MSAGRKSKDDSVLKMDKVHIFSCSNRFRSRKELRKFLDKRYTRDGDGIPSEFMREVGLTSYEPMCIEAQWYETPAPLSQLLAHASYADQWLPQLDGTITADVTICVYAPNQVERPEQSSLQYNGSFQYRVR